jgi:hypothetical protein
VVAIGVDAGDKAAAEAKDPRMSCWPTPFMRTPRWCFARAATERVKVPGALTGETSITFTFSHRLAAALRPLPAAIGRKAS